MRVPTVLLFSLVFACAESVTRPIALQPTAAPGGEGEAAGIRVQALDDWPNPSAERSEVLPLRITLENDRDDAVLIRYQDFVLVGARRYAALPPFQVTTNGGGAVLGYDYPPIPRPELQAEAFRVAPQYAPVYPSLAPMTGPFANDSAFYVGNYGEWRRRKLHLPTDRMLQKAVPEGVLDPGGDVAGYIYFALPANTETHLELRVDIVLAGTGRSVGQVTIPFSVHR